MDDATVDDVGAMVRATGPAVYDDLSRSLLLAGDTGTAPGVHAGRVQALQ